MKTGDSKFYLQLQKDAEDIVEDATKLLVSMEHTFTIAVQKDEVDLATNADTEAEKLIIDRIHQKYPDHGIEGEESGTISNTSPYVWVIDPLDGTKEYARGIGEYNCLLAVEENRLLVVGVTRRIGINSLYSASHGNGAYRDGKPIHVSANTDLSKSLVGFHLPNIKNTKDAIENNMLLVKQLIYRAYRVRPGWDTAKQLGWMAQGILDAHIVPPLVNKWVDVASTIILVEEAGGTVTDYNGNKVRGNDFHHGIVASNGKLHEELLDIIKKSIKRE